MWAVEVAQVTGSITRPCLLIHAVVLLKLRVPHDSCGATMIDACDGGGPECVAFWVAWRVDRGWVGGRFLSVCVCVRACVHA